MSLEPGLQKGTVSMRLWILLLVVLGVAACASHNAPSQAVPRSNIPEERSSNATLPTTLRGLGLPEPSAVPAVDARPTPATISESTPMPTAALSPPTPTPASPQPSSPQAPLRSETAPPTSIPVGASAAVPATPPSEPPGPGVPFFDTSRFDSQLSSAMRRNAATVVVTFAAPASVNDIPQRLNKWLSVVEKNAGTVELQPDPDYPVITQRGAFGIVSTVLGAFAAIYEAIENRILYGPAKGYNATVYYMRGSGVMTKVVFTRKPPREKS